MSELSKQKKNPHRFMGVARELIDWYPVINRDKCNNCADCVEFCAHDVFEVKNDIDRKSTRLNSSHYS